MKSLTLPAILKTLSAVFRRVPDQRMSGKVDYQMHDTLMCGFAMFFFQHPSLLKFQERMKQQLGLCNLETIFGITAVPSDSQMREILDPVDPHLLRRLLARLFEKVRRAGQAEQYKTTIPSGKHKGGWYTMPLDGVQYFHSTKVECPRCLEKKEKNGTVHYSHCVVAATLVKAGTHRIFPLDAEEVCRQDGQEKQDCEINAAKRLLPRFRAEHPQLPVIIGGDDLYAHEPFVLMLAEQRLHYVLVAKPESHRELFKWVEDLERLKETGHGEWTEGPACKRRFFRYRIARQVPLRAEGKVETTFVEVWETDRNGKQVYHNSWVTDLDVDEENVSVVIAIGRSRWKIENEQFNIQKNHGYELEHNYGHGKQNLSLVFDLLNQLAFVTHLILKESDRLFQCCLKQEGLRETWNILRALMRTGLFASWDEMLTKFVSTGETG
jgi:hypothetical protein